MIESIRYEDEAGVEIRHHKDDAVCGFTVVPGAELIFDSIPYIAVSSRVEGTVYVVVLRSGAGKPAPGEVGPI